MKRVEDLKKSQYGRISNKRKFNEELDLSLAAINNMSNGKRNSFNVGDMVWAKTGKFMKKDIFYYTFMATYNKNHPRHLIPEVCRQFYANGWVTGKGGGISIKYNDHIFIAPSGVQKERIEPDDLFVQNLKGEDIMVPNAEKKLSKSQCTPIFMCSYNERNAGAVIHVHSKEVVKLCLLNPENEHRITGLKMIKGIFNEKTGKFYDNDEELRLPIVENSKYEKDLVDTFKIALKKYPSTSAVLVRNHGIRLLQSKNQDKLSATNIIQSVLSTLKTKRQNSIDVFAEIFEICKSNFDELNISITLPRLGNKMLNRANPKVKKPDEFYRVAIFLPFIDNKICDLANRCSKEVVEIFDLDLFLPNVIVKVFLDKYVLGNKVQHIMDKFGEILIKHLSYSKDSINIKLAGEIELWHEYWINKNKIQSGRFDVDDGPAASETILHVPGLAEALVDAGTSDGSSMSSSFTTRVFFMGTPTCFVFRCRISTYHTVHTIVHTDTSNFLLSSKAFIKMTDTRRSRGKNFLDSEKDMLIDLIIPHKSIIENIKASTNPTNKKKNSELGKLIWQEVCDLYNSQTTNPKTIKEICDMYEIIKSEAKLNRNAEKADCSISTPGQDKILGFIGDRMDPLENKFDSDTEYLELIRRSKKNVKTSTNSVDGNFDIVKLGIEKTYDSFLLSDELNFSMANETITAIEHNSSNEKSSTKIKLKSNEPVAAPKTTGSNVYRTLNELVGKRSLMAR
ncbi:hypothetical protein ACI65C_006626 [Semiaphis heraclei]